MRRSGAVSTKFGGIDTQRCVEAWREQHPVKTAACLAHRYGAPIRTVENWLSGTVPSGQWLGVMFEVEDADFLERVMVSPPEWVREAARAARTRRRAADRAELARQIAALDAELDGLEHAC